MTRIKLCGLRRPEDIEMANEFEPDFVGFIIDFPKSHRSVTPQEAKNLATRLNPKIPRVGVFVNQPVEKVISLLNDSTIDIAQLHGSEPDEYIERVRGQTGKQVIKAFEISCEEDIERALHSPADYLLLDRGKGAGQAFDWGLIRKRIDRSWFLAGGLLAENLQEAIDAVHPWGLDMSSGIETDGFKDAAKIREVMEIVRKDIKF